MLKRRILYRGLNDSCTNGRNFLNCVSVFFGSTMELARTCIGTPYYLSPEICENRPYNNKR